MVSSVDPPPSVQIYTDGGCDPNPGPGGWGAVLISGARTKEISGGALATTNNRMELTAAISALRSLTRRCDVEVYTDSQYLRKGMTEWLTGWQENGWRRANGKPIQNEDLWRELSGEVDRHHVEWRWIRGHRGHPLNERADELAAEGRLRLLAEGTPGQALVESGDRWPNSEALPVVEIHARGCALGVPGPGGYAAIVSHDSGQTRVVSGGWPLATNNAMELWAAIAGLRALDRPSSATVYTTSKYVLGGATRWLADWESSGFRTRRGHPVKNKEIWLELAHLMGDHDVTWRLLARDRRGPLSLRAARIARSEAEGMKRKPS